MDLFDLIKIYRLKNYVIKKGMFPPSYEDDRDCYVKSQHNCLAYALQIDNKIMCFNKRFDLGQLSNTKPKLYNEKGVKTAFENDCRVLGLEVEETNSISEIVIGKYKIALYTDAASERISWNFHLIRQNIDGWSQKIGWYLDPVRMEFAEHLRFEKVTYNFAAVYNVSKRSR